MKNSNFHTKKTILLITIKDDNYLKCHFVEMFYDYRN